MLKRKKNKGDSQESYQAESESWPELSDNIKCHVEFSKTNKNQEQPSNNLTEDTCAYSVTIIEMSLNDAEPSDRNFCTGKPSEVDLNASKDSSQTMIKTLYSIHMIQAALVYPKSMWIHRSIQEPTVTEEMMV
eukprot:1459183-Ditylum_brightwellii.AAC.1